MTEIIKTCLFLFLWNSWIKICISEVSFDINIMINFTTTKYPSTYSTLISQALLSSFGLKHVFTPQFLSLQVCLRALSQSPCTSPFVNTMFSSAVTRMTPSSIFSPNLHLFPLLTSPLNLVYLRFPQNFRTTPFHLTTPPFYPCLR